MCVPVDIGPIHPVSVLPVDENRLGHVRLQRPYYAQAAVGYVDVDVDVAIAGDYGWLESTYNPLE